MSSSPRILSRRDFMKSGAGLAAGPLVLGLSRKSFSETGPIFAKLMVEPESAHKLSRHQYGHFIEHLGKCIKGGVWAEGESEDMFLGGIRWELVEAVRSLNPSLIRYPGGCFADGYHWRDGVGPREQRPRRWNRAWGKFGPLVGPVEDNHFGTDEFMAFCEAVGAEPMLTVNVGSGTPEEAAAWVEYCNGDKETKEGAQRANNGHPEPYRVKFWFVGNEIFGWHEIGHLSPSEYVKVFKKYAGAMRKVDPDLKLIAVGNHQLIKGVSPNRTVLEGLGEELDYLSIHRYVPGPSAGNTLRYQLLHLHQTGLRSVFYQVMGTLLEMESWLDENIKELRAFRSSDKVRLALDEWNLWFSFLEDIVHANYCLRDGVWVASMLNLLHRRAEEVPIANIAQMVNCLGIITSTRRGTFLTPSALAFKLYTESAGDELLESEVSGPGLDEAGGIPAVDVSATRGPEKLSLFLVNREYEKEISLQVELKGMRAEENARRRQIFHPDPAKFNTYREPEAVRLLDREEKLAVERKGTGSSFRMLLPPHSITCLELRADKA